MLLSLLGGPGLMLAVVGVCGMTAYAVSRRTAEIGLRMAFGARPGQVVQTMVRDSAAPIVIGMLVGLGGAPPQWIRYRGLLDLRYGNKDDSLVLDIEPWASPGKTVQVTVNRDTFARFRSSRQHQLWSFNFRPAAPAPLRLSAAAALFNRGTQ